MSNTFICEKCKREFPKGTINVIGWSEEKALAELKANFGVPVEACAIVCDDCYDEIMGEIDG